MKHHALSRFPAVALAAGLTFLSTADKASGSVVLTFDDPPVLDAPGGWVVDRYAPAIFQSAIVGGENVLEFGVSQDDRQGLRPSGFTTEFRNTQGRKLEDLPDFNRFASSDFLIPSTIPSGLPMSVGLWNRAGSTYPIIAYHQGISDTFVAPGGSNPYNANFNGDGLYFWITGNGWTPALTTASPGVTRDDFIDLWMTFRVDIDVDTDVFVYSVVDGDGNLLVGDSMPAGGQQNFQELFLNMTNWLTGDPDEPQTFSVFVDNVSYTPEPSRALLISLALVPVLLRRRRAGA